MAYLAPWKRVGFTTSWTSLSQSTCEVGVIRSYQLGCRCEYSSTSSAIASSRPHTTPQIPVGLRGLSGYSVDTSKMSTHPTPPGGQAASADPSPAMTCITAADLRTHLKLFDCPHLGSTVRPGFGEGIRSMCQVSSSYSCLALFSFGLLLKEKLTVVNSRKREMGGSGSAGVCTQAGGWLSTWLHVHNLLGCPPHETETSFHDAPWVYS